MAAREPKRRRVSHEAIVVEWKNSHNVFKPLAECGGETAIVTCWSQGAPMTIPGLANLPPAEAIHGLVRTAAARMHRPGATVRVRTETRASQAVLAFARGETVLHRAAIDHFQALVTEELCKTP